jgi:hypothetical protein
LYREVRRVRDRVIRGALWSRSARRSAPACGRLPSRHSKPRSGACH